MARQIRTQRSFMLNHSGMSRQFLCTSSTRTREMMLTVEKVTQALKVARPRQCANLVQRSSEKQIIVAHGDTDRGST